MPQISNDLRVAHHAQQARATFISPKMLSEDTAPGVTPHESLPVHVNYTSTSWRPKKNAARYPIPSATSGSNAVDNAPEERFYAVTPAGREQGISVADALDLNCNGSRTVKLDGEDDIMVFPTREATTKTITIRLEVSIEYSLRLVFFSDI